MPLNGPIFTNLKLTHCNTAFTPLSIEWFCTALAASNCRSLGVSAHCLSSAIGHQSKEILNPPPTLRGSQCIFDLVNLYRTGISFSLRTGVRISTAKVLYIACACFTINVYILWTKRWRNNEIICIVLEINQRYFSSSKKNAVEMFSAYMQEVNLKKCHNFQSILLVFLFRAPSLRRKLQLQNL
jgi:hypothetical protein